MEREGSGTDFQTLLQSIKSSDVVEKRAQLIGKLEDLVLTEKSDIAALVDCLSKYWEDFTCLDASQCMLNKTILNVAAKYVDSDLSGCLVQFLAFVTKASIWCGKHLKMTLMSSEDSQEEEHCNLYFQLLLDFLSLSAASVTDLTKYPVFADQPSMVIIERFILEQLNLTKDVLLDAERINSFGPEALKVAQKVLGAVMGICKEYSVALNWDLCDARPEKNESSTDSEKDNMMNHAINLTKCTIDKLCELGVLAALSGGSLVSILNVSWKGVVNLLELGKRVLSDIINVHDIILILIPLVLQPLRCLAEAWSSQHEAISKTEARRAFLPVKFYLIQALKISSLYPCQAYRVHKEVALCALMISTYRILLSHEKLLNTASEVCLELLAKTSIDFVGTLLNSAEVTQEQKFQILDWLFVDECRSNLIQGDSSGFPNVASMAERFSVSCETIPGATLLVLGQVELFHQFLRHSVYLQEDVRNKIIRKLGWLLDRFVDEEIYSSVLSMQIPVRYGSGETVEVLWQPMVSALSHALKTFMIVVSSSHAWVELETFLLDNLFHPHFLCREIVLELWCFLVRHADIDTVNNIIGKLCSLMKLVDSPELVLNPGSPLRKLARTISLLLTHGTPSMADRVYCSVVDEGSQFPSVMYVALLLEGFPLNSLSNNKRSIAKEKIMTNYFTCIGSVEDKLMPTSGALGIPILALSASLQSHQVSISDVDMKTLKFLLAVIRNIKNPAGNQVKEHWCKLLSEILRIISNMTHLYESDNIKEVILELRNLFVTGPTASNTQLYLCKPYLALFMGGLGHMKMKESDDCAKSCAVWELYHMLFRERHWALVHLSIAAFGYFAARTSCNKLWRFVPRNAALSYDLVSGNEANEDGFMSEFKAFLEKKVAIRSTTPITDQIESLAKDGIVLKEMVQRISNIQLQDLESQDMEIDVVNQPNKRRKLPDEIGKGVEMLQSGLNVIAHGLSQWKQNNMESPELHDKFLTQFACLEDVVAHLMDLTGNT